MTPLDRVTIASRVFCLAAILGLVFLSRDLQALVSLLLLATIATTGAYVSLATPLPSTLVVAIEAIVTALIIGLALPEGVVLLPYLVVLSLIAGVSRGVVGVSAVAVVHCSTIWVVATTWAPEVSKEELLRALSPWLLTSIGVGLLGSWVRTASRLGRGTASDASYEAAHRLLTQLRTVAKRLSSGLDPRTIAGHIMDELWSCVATDQCAVFVRTDGGVLAPLAYSNELAREHLSSDETVIRDCWAELQPVVGSPRNNNDSRMIALPLRVGNRMLGVVLARLATTPPAGSLANLMRELDDHSLRLDTALTFDEIRSIATVEERRRLAREIHDGIAQEVASLGYVVDDLLARAESEPQRSGLASLRQELTRVVSELRLSIFDLRSEVLQETGLGTALSEYLQQVGSRSPLTVHLSLDEAPTRLRAETESELLRIAQEAITNTRKHSGAKNLWVHCRVQPPFACLEVRDDGTGLSPRGIDSYGLDIMKERAERLNARLEVQDNSGRWEWPGTLVRVTLGAEPSEATPRENEQSDVSNGSENRPNRRRP